MRIDSHQHFWKFDASRDSWITDDMSAIKKDFLPADLQPILQQYSFDGCVTVQSNQTEAENEFQLQNAAQNDFIKGIVGWTDLQANDVEQKLSFYSRSSKMKGFRHVLQGEKDRALMIQPLFKRGVALLSKYGFTYDLLILPDQLRYAYQLASRLPNQKFVIDHIAKPTIKTGGIADWKRDIGVFKPLENVSCKVSGMVTEADWKKWKPEDFKPYLDAVVETFSTKRILYGSDWPASLVAADYGAALSLVQDYFSTFSEEEQDDFFGRNATAFYNL